MTLRTKNSRLPFSGQLKSCVGISARLFAVAALMFSAGCSSVMDGFVSRSSNVDLPIGPPIEDVVTPFDAALSCINGKVNPGIIFAVGQVVDATGKESYADGGTGKYITQGAGEMVQTALFRSGVTLVNRRDPGISITETQWGIRDLQQQVPVNFYISGSINSLDFIPGGGFSTTVSGVGPRFRQNRILIGLDLSLTDAFTGRIVANVPLQKQIFSREVGTSIGRFFGDTLISFDVGGMEREALHFTMRQMLSLATLQLLGQLMNEDAFKPCVAQISPIFGALDLAEPQNDNLVRAAMAASSELSQARASAARTTEESANVQPAPQQASARVQTAKSVEDQLAEIRNQTTIYAARAIGAAERSLRAETAEVRANSAAEASQLVASSAQLLRRAAQLGLTGPEGDAAAIVVQRALELTGEANEAVAAQAVAQTDAADARYGSAAQPQLPASSPAYIGPMLPSTSPLDEARSTAATPLGLPVLP